MQSHVYCASLLETSVKSKFIYILDIFFNFTQKISTSIFKLMMSINVSSLHACIEMQ